MPAETSCPTLSVVVPCFNGHAWLRSCIDSIRAAAEGVSHEIVVVDDGSTLGYEEIVNGLSDVLLLRKDNGGPASARNVGLVAARGEWVAFVDVDDQLIGGAFLSQLAHTTSCDVVQSMWVRRFQRFEGELVDEIGGQELAGDVEALVFSEYWAPIGSYLYRRSFIDGIRWREEFPIVEDVCFVVDVARRGPKWAWNPKPTYVYVVRDRDSQSTRDKFEFARCCLEKALVTRNRWKAEGRYGSERRRAVTGALFSAAQMAAENTRGEAILAKAIIALADEDVGWRTTGLKFALVRGTFGARRAFRLQAAWKASLVRLKTALALGRAEQRSSR